MLKRGGASKELGRMDKNCKNGTARHPYTMAIAALYVIHSSFFIAMRQCPRIFLSKSIFAANKVKLGSSSFSS